MTAEVLKAKPGIDAPQTGLAPETERRFAEQLSVALADTYVLLVKTHVFHWNVVGPLFKPLHELLEEHYKNLFEAADEIAERIRALGQPTPVTFADLLPRATIAEEKGLRSAEGIVVQLVKDHERVARDLRELATEADDAHDHVTHDLLTERLAFHEKAIWMLRSMVAG